MVLGERAPRDPGREDNRGSTAAREGRRLRRGNDRRGGRDAPVRDGHFAIAYGGAEAYWIANRSQVYVFEPGQLVVPRLRPLASCFVSKAVSLEAVRTHLSELALQPVGDGVLEVEGDGFTVLVVETRLEPSYAGTRYGTAMGMWAPQSVGDVGPAVNAPFFAAEALLVCERLNALRGSLLWDLVLRCSYPKA